QIPAGTERRRDGSSRCCGSRSCRCRVPCLFLLTSIDSTLLPTRSVAGEVASKRIPSRARRAPPVQRVLEIGFPEALLDAQGGRPVVRGETGHRRFRIAIQRRLHDVTMLRRDVPLSALRAPRKPTISLALLEEDFPEP